MVKDIRKESGEKKQTKLNVSDEFRNIINVMIVQVDKDDKYTQMYKRRKGNMEVLL